jgi:S-adenosylmethionine hydrolase
MSAEVIAFLSDYGHRDEFVGVCHGVLARRCPAARVIDVTHAIPRHDVRTGALVLYEDGERMAALAVNRGSAMALLGVERDDELIVRPA